MNRSLLLAGALLFGGCTVATGDRPGEGAPGDDYGTESVRCAGGPTVDGLDVSQWQGKVNWSSVKASGRHFAIARISDGGHHDSYFAANWAGIKAAGMIRGAYQFFRPGQDANAQADIVIAAVGKLGDGDLPVTLDVEASDGVSGTAIAASIHTWVTRVEAATGKKPIIYTGKYFWRDSVGSTAFGSDALWIAAYGPTCPDIPSPWLDWRFFQFSDKGSVAGISGGVDLDKFNGTLADLIAFAGGSGASGGGTTGGGTTGGGTSGGGATGVCYSHTLGTEVALNTCVQSKADSKWYQCAGPNHWVDRATDPAACSSVHPL